MMTPTPMFATAMIVGIVVVPSVIFVKAYCYRSIPETDVSTAKAAAEIEVGDNDTDPSKEKLNFINGKTALVTMSDSHMNVLEKNV